MPRRPEPSRYHHGNLRETLIATALERIRAEGVDALSLRALARAAGVSQTAPYRHFRDKEALLVELARGGFEMLAEAMEREVAAAGDEPLARLRASGRGYVRFAVANAERYRLMFGSRRVDKGCHPELAAAGERAYGVLNGLIEAGIAAGVLRQRPAAELALASWALVHGLAGLLINGMVEPEAAVLERMGELLHHGIAAPGGGV